jgi:hypothetical protein
VEDPFLKLKPVKLKVAVAAEEIDRSLYEGSQ